MATGFPALVFRRAPFSITTETFGADFYALPLDGYDVVLGTEWLATWGPILWDFSRLSMTFWHVNSTVTWRGIAGSSGKQLRASSGPDLLEALLADFDDIFAAPTSLPPPRSRDHHIHLLP